MKYTLHIAFDEKIGDIVLRTNERIKKFSQAEAPCFMPLLFTPTSEGFDVQRPELNCPAADLIVFAAEVATQSYLSWMTKNRSISLICDEDITDFFEHIYLQNITTESGFDPELHIMFYTPLYETNILQYLNAIIQNLPKDYKIIVNIIAIPYDMGERIGTIKYPLERDSRNAIMTETMAGLIAFKQENYCKHIIFFQNRNIDGWALSFDKDKFICICSDIATCLISNYHEIVKHVEPDRPIFAINSQSYVLDIYHALNDWLRNLFLEESQEYLIDEDDENAQLQADEIFKQVLQSEKDILKKFISGLNITTKEYSIPELEELFNINCRQQIIDAIDKYCANVNATVRYLLYKKFKNVKNLSNSNTDDQLLDALELDKLFIDLLPLDSDLKTAYTKLEDCLTAIKMLKKQIENDEAVLQSLQNKLSAEDYQLVEVNEDGLLFGDKIYKPNTQKDFPLASTYTTDSTENLPSMVDLRKYFPKIKNQGAQGACSAFSLVSVFEYFLQRISNNYTDLSEAFPYYNARKISGKTNEDFGSTFRDIVQAAMDWGLCLENICPYNDKIYNQEPTQDAYNDGKDRRITEAKNVQIDTNHIKSALAKGLPVVVSVQAIEVMRKNTNGFISYEQQISKTKEDEYHAMVICGYSDYEGYFIVRNSWGEEYGDKGYCYLPYSLFRDKHLISGCYVITGINDKGLENLEIEIEENGKLYAKTHTAQYEVLRNIIVEKTYQLAQRHEQLDKERETYVELCKQLGEPIISELTIEEIDKQIDDIRKKKDSSFFKGLFAGKEDKEALSKLMMQRNSILINTIVVGGILDLNLWYLEEAEKIENTSKVLAEDNLRINRYIQKDSQSYFRKISPKTLNFKELINNSLNEEAIIDVLNNVKGSLSDMLHNRIGVYELFTNLLTHVTNNILANSNLTIADYLHDEVAMQFFNHINSSSVMAMIDGGVPKGYGEEVIHLLSPISLENIGVKLCNQVNYLQSTDPYRITFLHVERYDMEHFTIFNPNNHN